MDISELAAEITGVLAGVVCVESAGVVRVEPAGVVCVEPVGVVCVESAGEPGAVHGLDLHRSPSLCRLAEVGKR